MHEQDFMIFHLQQPVANSQFSRMRYCICRSTREKTLHVLYYADRFKLLPDQVRRRGPWERVRSGEIAALQPAYRAALAERGHVLLQGATAVLLAPPTGRAPNGGSAL